MDTEMPNYYHTKANWGLVFLEDQNKKAMEKIFDEYAPEKEESSEKGVVKKDSETPGRSSEEGVVKKDNLTSGEFGKEGAVKEDNLTSRESSMEGSVIKKDDSKKVAEIINDKIRRFASYSNDFKRIALNGC